MRLARHLFMASALLIGLAGCSDSADMPAPMATPVSYDEAGPYNVANRTISIMNSSLGRSLTVELWYPSQGTGNAQVIQDFAADSLERDGLDTLLADNPGNCVRQETSSSRNLPAAMSPERFPLVIFSHCHECVRYSFFSMAERLASHGFAVAAPDHLMNTLFNSGAMLSGEFLEVRASDVSAVADELLIPNSAALPMDLQGRFDSAQLGVAGHSFGAVTTGRVLQDDDRFRAGFIMAAPIENPLIPGVSVDRVAEPTFYLIAQEDNSITELGNVLMRANFEAASSPSWKVEVTDAGHWSFSDIAGIIPGFSPGCGEGERQTNPGEVFTFLDPQTAADVVSSYAVRFFAAHLRDDQDALSDLGTVLAPGIVDVEQK